MARAIENHQAPSFFVRGPSPFARLVFFAVLSISLMATDSRLHYLIEVRQGFMALINPLQMIANAPSELYRSTQSFFSSHRQLIHSNDALKISNMKQGQALQRLATLEAENSHLRSLLGATQAITQASRVAEILHMGRDPFTHKITVNLGSRQGVESGQAVVDGAGVIGQVTRVYPFSSEVTLITDKDLAIPVQIERNGLRAIAFGHGRDTTIDLPYLPANVDIRQGDKLVTSGIDGVYPLGLAVAEVSKIERNPDSPFAHIVCKPIAGIENHLQVLLLETPKADTAIGKVIDAAAKTNISHEKSSAKNKPAASTNASH